MLVFDTTFASLADDYIHQLYLRKGHIDPTMENRINRLINFFGDGDSIGPKDIEYLLNSMGDKKPATRNRFRSQLKAIIQWARDMDRVPVDEMNLKQLTAEPENNQRDIRVSREQEKKILKKLDPNMQRIVIGALDTGLRRGALLKLRVEDIRDDKLVVRGETQKTKKGQIIPLTKRLKTLLDGRNPDEEYLFPGWSLSQWNRAKRVIKGLHFHDLRGEFASRLAEKKVPIHIVSRLLSHSSISTTQRYLRSRVEDFEEAIETLND